MCMCMGKVIGCVYLSVRLSPIKLPDMEFYFVTKYPAELAFTQLSDVHRRIQAGGTKGMCPPPLTR